MAFYTSAQSSNKDEFLIYVLILENINKSGLRNNVSTSPNIIKLMPASWML